MVNQTTWRRFWRELNFFVCRHGVPAGGAGAAGCRWPVIVVFRSAGEGAAYAHSCGRAVAYAQGSIMTGALLIGLRAILGYHVAMVFKGGFRYYVC